MTWERVASTMAGLGGLVSAYALWVEQRAKYQPQYVASCDLSPSVSCSRVLTSRWSHIASASGLVPSGHTLDQPNAAIGAVFFILCMSVLVSPLARRSKAWVVLCASVPALLTSAVLAYVLVTQLKTLCLVCAASYAVNAGLFLSALAGLRAGPPTGGASKAKKT